MDGGGYLEGSQVLPQNSIIPLLSPHIVRRNRQMQGQRLPSLAASPPISSAHQIRNLAATPDAGLTLGCLVYKETGEARGPVCSRFPYLLGAILLTKVLCLCWLRLEASQLSCGGDMLGFCASSGTKINTFLIEIYKARSLACSTLSLVGARVLMDYNRFGSTYNFIFNTIHNNGQHNNSI